MISTRSFCQTPTQLRQSINIAAHRRRNRPNLRVSGTKIDTNSTFVHVLHFLIIKERVKGRERRLGGGGWWATWEQEKVENRWTVLMSAAFRLSASVLPVEFSSHVQPTSPALVCCCCSMFRSCTVQNGAERVCTTIQYMGGQREAARNPK